MENTSYALQIAAGVLIAVLIIALISFVYTNLSSYQSSQDDEVARENLQEFNQAFEVYDKSLMYGTDVLSCLNQAENNNQKYVYNVYYSNDSSEITYKDREEYIIQVNVKLNSTIEEKVSVYYINTNGSTVKSTSQTYKLNSKTIFSTNSSTGIFTLPTITYYYFSENLATGSEIFKETETYSDIMWTNATSSSLRGKTLESKTYYTTMADGDYSLVAEDTSSTTRKKTSQLIALLSTVTTVEQTVYNDNYTGTGESNWYSATWTTAVYDFKTRKFKCTDISYNADTGYVNSISFEEVDT